jgi:negative regulator of flagellin synthesis FlgM
VPHKIDGFENRPVQVGTDRAVQRKGLETEAEGAPKTSIGGADTVSITGSARQLAALEQALKEQPAVDEARVARLRAAIESGSYQVDASRIADKLLRLEEQLTKATPQK